MELFKLFGTIVIDGADKAKDALDKIGSTAVKAGKVIGAGIAAGATAIGALTKTAVESYAEYEQLVGGVDTLFKDSSGKVQQYAANAYKTAGLSANEYMETVTSFSASLLQSLGGDTEKAAEVADRAITDMSDNANKMGTDMASIQNAYQGFAKQNYTMLDNLKLGYGGTKEEMERLLEDAEKLSGQKFDLSSYADIVEAIHVVQTEMDITGTTAKEASSTIEGSLNATKSAWKNLVTGFGDEKQNLDVLIGNLVDSATTAAQNIVPRIAQILGGITDAMEQIMPVVSEQLPAILEQLLPGVISGATSLVTGLIQSLPQILQLLIQQIPFIVTQIATALKTTFPILLDTVKQLLSQIIDYISGILGKASSWLNENLIQPVIKAFEGFKESVTNVWEGIWGSIKGIMNNMLGGIESWINGAIEAINKFIDGINKMSSVVRAFLGLGTIPTIPLVNLPRLEQGGILEKGQVGLLEGNGAEAVVPLDQNRAWISAVAEDMQTALGGSAQSKELKEAFDEFVERLPDMLIDAFSSVRFDINNREFARMVKAV